MQILYFTENKIIFESRAVHSTDHAFLQLIDQIYNCFDEKRFYLGIFVDLSKAFDTVHHKILIKKLEKYGIFGKLLWFKSYYSNRKQYAEYKNDFDEQKLAYLLQLKCRVPQVSTLGPFHFLIYINDLSLVSKYLSSVMFADNTNLFCFFFHKNIKILCKNANEELEKICQWLILIKFH